ncbi:hypothetical protein DXG01_013608, partial [Tephrocybe rancida]
NGLDDSHLMDCGAKDGCQQRLYDLELEDLQWELEGLEVELDPEDLDFELEDLESESEDELEDSDLELEDFLELDDLDFD